MSPAAFQHPLPRAQRGVILIITLIILTAMTLAAVAMLNSVDTSTSIAGNVSFKQSATNSADQAIDAAGAFLIVPKQNTDADNPASGYYATSQDNFDITGNKTPGVPSDDLDWSGAGIVTLAKDSAGNTVSYRINRMCDAAGAVSASTCAVKVVESSKAPAGVGIVQPTSTYQQRAGNGKQSIYPYYRITMRIAGPKNNVSYVQTVVTVQ